jgi:hypothetical protein
MPRRGLLTPAERTGLLAFPTTDDDLIPHHAVHALPSDRFRRATLYVCFLPFLLGRCGSILTILTSTLIDYPLILRATRVYVVFATR